jgi:glycosyltransferase involved in cell wall biosynthesis
MSEVKTVLYTGAFRFPDQDAAAFRVFSLAGLFRSSGCNVVFAGWESASDGIRHYVYRGYNCFSQDEFRNDTTNPLRRLFGFLFRGHKTALWIWKNRKSFDVIVAYNPTVFLSLLLLLMGKLVPFQVVLDSTEWYESNHLPGGSLGLASFENWVRMNLAYKLFSNVICISSFLENHFTGKNSLRIPPLLPDNNLIKLERPDINAGVNLIYAGESGKKDRLTAIIASLPKIQDEIRTRIQLHIVGMTWDELSALLDGHGLNPNHFSIFVVCHGRLTRKEVLNLYCFCHFSVLFRDSKRYALAGFPTKAMESLASGCPIITNAVGDLSKLLENGVNAFILEESELTQKLPVLLNHALLGNCYKAMVKSARITAIEHFSPDVYKNKFSEFFDTLFGRQVKG